MGNRMTSLSRVYAERGRIMISAEEIKGVHQLLEDAGVQQQPGESLAHFVARGLGISAGQACVLLQSLHDGASVQDAVGAAEIDATNRDNPLLVQVARMIG